ncbi:MULTISPECIES: hypothetical protein [Psychrobacter]|uniref:hypothetical protein n=1 Tax=Psychrobacter TaxID=497 RepID=UPI00146A6E2E|nr:MULTISPECIES: hypothetical protein [Psychrobacter]
MGRNHHQKDNDFANKAPSTPYQRRQASVWLWRLQWLIILLLILALIWLMVAQARFEQKINERLQNSDQLSTRLNDMDDRLFAISQQTLPKPKGELSNQAKNQLDLLKIQLQAATRLLDDNNLTAAIELLRGLQWQLSQSRNEIAPALTIVIKNSLSQDIERLQAQSRQSNPWQLQNLAIQNIQAFLQQSAQSSSSQNPQNFQRQLIIHETIMTLNLALQASHLHQSDELARYLRQSRSQLTQIQTAQSSTTATSTTTNNNAKSSSKPSVKIDPAAPTTLDGAIHRLDELIENKPSATLLLTSQMLAETQDR